MGVGQASINALPLVTCAGTVHMTQGPIVTEFRQPLQVQTHLEMPGILVQQGHIQRT